MGRRKRTIRLDLGSHRFLEYCPLVAGELLGKNFGQCGDGFRVQLAKGAITVTDGPFTETKEVIGGWAILEADSKTGALRIAQKFMELHRKYWPEFEGESEVRPMFEAGAGVESRE